MPPETPARVRIAAQRNTLQPSEARVADLIAADPEAVIELTAQELADRAGVARSSVVRACQSLGYRGYPQLRVALAAELARTAPEETQYGDDALGTVRAAIDRTARVLGAATSLLDGDTLDAVVRGTVAAGRVLVVANGLSAPVAADLAMRLTAVGRPAEVVSDAIAQQIAARQLSSGDLCVVVSASGANESSLRAAAAAVRSGATVVALTSFSSSPLTEIATLSLVVATGAAGFRDELEHTSRVAHAVFVEAFVEAVAGAGGDGARSVREQVWEILSENLADRG